MPLHSPNGYTRIAVLPHHPTPKSHPSAPYHTVIGPQLKSNQTRTQLLPISLGHSVTPGHRAPQQLEPLGRAEVCESSDKLNELQRVRDHMKVTPFPTAAVTTLLSDHSAVAPPTLCTLPRLYCSPSGPVPAHGTGAAQTAPLPPQRGDRPEPPPPPLRTAPDAPPTGSGESQWARPAAPASTNRNARGGRGSAESVAAVANDEGAYCALRRLPRSFPPSGGGGRREPYLWRTWRRGRWNARTRSARGCGGAGRVSGTGRCGRNTALETEAASPT